MSDREPEAGFATEGRIIKVIDADTVDVEIKRIVRVRLSHPNDKKLDFNAAEKNTLAGMNAKTYLSLISMGRPITVFFPAKSPEILLDNTSFNRIIGEIWLGGKRLTQTLLEAGYAKLSKRGHYEEDVGNSSAYPDAP